MGKASRLPERATTAKPTDTKSTESQRPTWSCLPLTRTEFAHGLPSYLSRINPKYKYFIEYAALHDCGVTFANSKVAAAVAQGCGGGGTRLRRRWHRLRRRWHEVAAAVARGSGGCGTRLRQRWHEGVAAVARGCGGGGTTYGGDGIEVKTTLLTVRSTKPPKMRCHQNDRRFRPTE